MITPNPLLGLALHAIGAVSAAFCYTPQKGTRHWSWQTYWLAQASVCWLALPFLGAWLTVPELGRVLAEAPRSAMLTSFGLGALYGVGGTAFGVAIRYLGFSLTYAIAIGISCVLGTLLPALWQGELAAIWQKPGTGFVLTGIVIGAAGIFASGLAGRYKELDRGGQSNDFNLAKGLPLCLLAGVLSAVYGFALAAGQPIADVAAAHGAGHFQGNAIYIFSNTGAFLTTAVYSLWLHTKHKTLGEYVELPAGGENSRLPLNFALALLTGCLWYGQFFFYGLAHVRMGDYQFSSWALHMIMLVLFSSLAGFIWREWAGCKPRTWTLLGLALVILVGAVLSLAYGNFLGDTGAGH
jgi:L-rhamnose-H+ transport protein